MLVPSLYYMIGTLRMKMVTVSHSLDRPDNATTCHQTHSHSINPENTNFLT